IFGGMPFVGAMNGDEFYPTFLLRLLFPVDVGMTWGFIVHIFLAGLFTYLFLRACRFSFLAALTGGVAYMMGGPISSYVSPGHDGKLFVSALMPLALWMLLRGMRDGRRWAWGVLALTTGLAVLSPHPQLLQYMLLTLGAFALWLVFTADDTTALERQTAWRRLGMAVIAVVLGFLMGAVQYLPFIKYIPWSPRSQGMAGGYAHAVSYSFPFEELINTYIPQFTGILDNYWGKNGIHFHSEYIGVVVFVLAVLGLARLLRGAHHSFARFWLGVLIVALLWSLGGYTPFYHLVYALVPGTRFFRAPSTMFFNVAFAIAIFVALGVERLQAGEVTIRYAVGWLIVGAIVLLLGVSGALTTAAETIAPVSRLDAVIANAPHLLSGAIRSAVFTLVAGGTLLLLATHRLDSRATALALLVLLAADLWSIERIYWRFSPPATTLYASDATIDYVKAQPEPGRVLAIPLGQDFAYHDPFLFGDALMVHGVRQVLGYQGNSMRYYSELTDNALGSPQLWHLLNVKYLLTNTDSTPIPGSRRLVGPVKDAAGTTVYLYSVPGDNPAAWVAPAIVKASDEAVLATVLDQRFDMRRAALFDTAARVTSQKLTALPDASPIRPTVTRYDPGYIEVELDRPATAGAALVVSENYYPAWTATVDGKPATIGRADLSLIGVALPEGSRKIVLTYGRSTFRHGVLITVVALLAVLAMIGGGVALERRPHE
ncbi:MAG TPA: YfhO family protein, partial [Gemmatimonadales bacterium]|nr:YfhO family protein [Gemmatimonadales bacterium]